MGGNVKNKGKDKDSVDTKIETPVVSDAPAEAPKPPTLDEADALKLEKFALQLENLQLQANQVVAQRDAFNGFLIQKYSIDPAHDQIDLPTRAIQRGVK